MTAATQQTHIQDGSCWHHHDMCALQRARAVLEISERRDPTVRTRDLLGLVRSAIHSHPDGVCPDAVPCLVVAMARDFLAES